MIKPLVAHHLFLDVFLPIKPMLCSILVIKKISFSSCKVMTWVFTTFNTAELKSHIHSISGLEYLYGRIPMDQLDLPAFITDYDIQVNHPLMLLILPHLRTAIRRGLGVRHWTTGHWVMV